MQTALTTVALKANNYAVQAGDLAITPASMDAANGNSFVPTGREILIFQNTDSASHTVTITSVADSLGRTDATLTTYSIAANSFAGIQMSTLAGWVSGGKVNLATSSALVKVAVLQTN